MVTHELTVFPDGRIDGAFSVREGDYNSHTLRFVLTQDLTAASAKLLLWAADAEKPDLVIQNLLDMIPWLDQINPGMHIDEAQQSSGMFVPFF